MKYWFDLKDFNVRVVRSELSEITEEIHSIINNGMHCVTGAKLMTLWITRDKTVFVCSALRIETVSG